MTDTDTLEKLHLEDLRPGASFRSGDWRVSAEEIIEFAERYDPQPFHTDPQAARATFFGGLAASGWHTAAITMRLLVTDGLPIAGGIIGAGSSRGRPRCAPARWSTWSRRCWKSRRRALVRTGASPCAAAARSTTRAPKSRSRR
jgi:hypothetical protein